MTESSTNHLPAARPERVRSRLLISVKEAADMLGVSPSAVMQLCEARVIPSGRIGVQIKIRPADVRAYAHSVIVAGFDHVDVVREAAEAERQERSAEIDAREKAYA